MNNYIGLGNGMVKKKNYGVIVKYINRKFFIFWRFGE